MTTDTKNYILFGQTEFLYLVLFLVSFSPFETRPFGLQKGYCQYAWVLNRAPLESGRGGACLCAPRVNALPDLSFEATY